MTLEEIRNEIDQIDEKLLGLFLRRMELGREAAEQKLRLGRPLKDSAREQHILNKVSESSGALSGYSERLFQELMALSRAYQSGLFEEEGALAQKVSEALTAEKARQLAEKQALYQALLPPVSQPEIQFAPLGALKPAQLEHALLLTAALAGVSLKEERLLVLVDAQQRALFALPQALSAGLRVLCPEEIPEAGAFSESTVFINTLPAHSVDAGAVLEKLPACRAVFDLCALLHRSPLLMAAEEMGLCTADGLALLALLLAEEKGLSAPSPESLWPLLTELRRDRGNIVIVGMPGSGKSAVAELISRKTGRRFINLDSEIVLKTGKSIPAIFAEEGEPRFRELEREAVRLAGAMTGAVIATGGGTIKDIRNYAPLHSNGRIYYLRRALEELEMEGRPLSKDPETLRQLEIEREPLYCRFADAEIQNDVDLAEAANRIIAEYAEYFSKRNPEVPCNL